MDQEAIAEIANLKLRIDGHIAYAATVTAVNITLARKTFLFRIGLLVSVALNTAQYWGAL